MMTILSSLVAPQVVVTTTCGVTSDDKSWHHDDSIFSAAEFIMAADTLVMFNT